MQYVIGGCADGQVEFEAECSFAIITSAACGTLCVFFKATCPTDGIGSRSSRPLQHAAVAAVVSDAKGCFHAQVICGGQGEALFRNFEPAASTGNFCSISDFYGGQVKLRDAWGAASTSSARCSFQPSKALLLHTHKTHLQPIHTVLLSYLARFVHNQFVVLSVSLPAAQQQGRGSARHYSIVRTQTVIFPQWGRGGTGRRNQHGAFCLHPVQVRLREGKSL